MSRLEFIKAKPSTWIATYAIWLQFKKTQLSAICVWKAITLAHSVGFCKGPNYGSSCRGAFL